LIASDLCPEGELESKEKTLTYTDERKRSNIYFFFN